MTYHFELHNKTNEVIVRDDTDDDLIFHIQNAITTNDGVSYDKEGRNWKLWTEQKNDKVVVYVQLHKGKLKPYEVEELNDDIDKAILYLIGYESGTRPS